MTADTATNDVVGRPAESVAGATQIRIALEEIAASYLSSPDTRGLVIAAVCGDVEACYCFGTWDDDVALPITSETIFEIGSITKVFTATALADMALKAEVALHDPVQKYLPQGTKLPKAAEGITLWHLATQTSGLRRLPRNLLTSRSDPKNPYAHYTAEDLYSGLRTARLSAKPGKLYSYSNFGVGLLGHVLGLVAGKSYEQLVKSRICDPLGMVDTTVSFNAEQQSRLAPGHARGKRTSNWELAILAGAGGLRSSGSDMLRFLRAQVTPESSSLGDAASLTQKHQYGLDARKQWIALCVMYLFPLMMWAVLRAMVNWMPVPSKLQFFVYVGANMLSVVAYVLYFVKPMLGRMTRIGLAWHFGRQEKQDVLWHNGATGGYYSFMAIMPAARSGVVVLSNCNKSVDGIGLKALAAITS